MKSDLYVKNRLKSVTPEVEPIIIGLLIKNGLKPIIMRSVIDRERFLSKKWIKI